MTESTENDNCSPLDMFTFPNFFSQWTDQGTQRLDAVVDQWEEWEKKRAEQVEKSTEDMAHLMRSTLDYSLELQAQMRQQALANTRKALTMLSGQGDQ